MSFPAKILLALLLGAAPARAQKIRAQVPLCPVSASAPSLPLDVRLPQSAAAPSALPPSAVPPDLALGATPSAPGAPAPEASARTDAAAAPAERKLDRLLQQLKKALPSDDEGVQAALAKIERIFTSKTSAAAKPPRMQESLSPEWVKKRIDERRGADKAVLKKQSQIRGQGFDKAALNPEILTRHNSSYTKTIPVGKVTNQQRSGRCWIFAGLNMLRDMLVAQGKVRKNFEFSENYLYYFSQLERSNLYLGKVIREVYGKKAKDINPRDLGDIAPKIGDDGKFADFQLLVEKYGLVPKNAMPETASSEGTDRLNKEINDSLGLAAQSLVADARRVAKTGGVSRAAKIRKESLTRLVKILTAHLGTPPARFARTTAGRRRSYTPQEFARKFAGFKFDDYAQVGSWSFRKRGLAYEFKKSFLGAPAPGDPPMNYRFVNVDIKRLEQLAVKALSRGKPVYIYVAMNRDVDKKSGIMHPKIFKRADAYDLSRRERGRKLSRAQATSLELNNGSHLMVLTGFDRPDKNGPIVKFRVENSWGPEFGEGGVFHMYREWFREHAYSIIVPKNLLSSDELKAWQSPARPMN